jgi:hypothetical protein
MEEEHAENLKSLLEKMWDWPAKSTGPGVGACADRIASDIPTVNPAKSSGAHLIRRRILLS